MTSALNISEPIFDFVKGESPSHWLLRPRTHSGTPGQGGGGAEGGVGGCGLVILYKGVSSTYQTICHFLDVVGNPNFTEED